MMMTVIHIGILKKNNNAGTFLRIGYTAVLILVMTFSSKVDSGDYLVCTVGLILFDVALMTENILAAVIFGYSVLCWGIAQPAILNRCHLVLWLLIFNAIRNLVIVENHSTVSWMHESVGRIFGAGFI